MAGPTLRAGRGHAAPAQPSGPDERYLHPGPSEPRLTRGSAPRSEAVSSTNRKGRADTKGGGRARTSHRKKGTDRRSANVSSAGGPESPSEDLRHKPREERSYKEFYSDLDVLSPMIVTVVDDDVTIAEKNATKFEGPGGQELQTVKNGEDPTDSVENKDSSNITANNAPLPQVTLDVTHVSPVSQENFSCPIMLLEPEDTSQGAPLGDPPASLDNEDNRAAPKLVAASLGVDCTRTCHRLLAGEVHGEKIGAGEVTQLDGGPVHDGILGCFKEPLPDRGNQLPAPSTSRLRPAAPSSGPGAPTADAAKQLPKPTYRAVDRNELVRAAIDYQWPGRQKPPRVRPAQHYIHYVEPTETELAERVEYDKDEQDREWLEALNEQRAQEGKVTYEMFELMIDRLEKEWFDLTKDLQKAANCREEPLSAEESKCAICDDGECENSNAIVFCDGCNLAVHQICYGIPYVPEGQWLCRKCMLMPEKAVKCMFCPNEGGAFKMTANRQWGHLLCALWIPEVGVSNPVLMEPIDQTDTISPKRWRLICYICRKRQGVCIQCEYRSCATAYHVTCARKAKLYMRMKTHGTHYDRTTFRAYCDKHSPPDYRGQEDVEGAREALGVVLTRKKLERIAPSAGAPEPTDGFPQNAFPDGEDDTAGGVGRPKTGEDKAAQAHQFEYKANGVVAPAYVFNRVLQQISRFQLRKKAAVLNFVCRYWSLKREARRGAPLLKRLHLEPWTASSSALRQTEEEKARKFQAVIALRRNLERQRTLAELLRKRERAKLERTRVMKMYVEELFYPIGRILMEMLDHLKKSDTQNYFAEPVSTADAPDYLDVIETPMDFSTMHRRIQELHYDSVDAFASDAELVFSNAIRYNRHDTVWHRAAVRLRRTLPALVREAKRKCDELGSTTIAHFAPEEVRERFDAALFDYTLEVDECVASDPAGPAPVPSR